MEALKKARTRKVKKNHRAGAFKNGGTSRFGVILKYNSHQIGIRYMYSYDWGKNRDAAVITEEMINIAYEKMKRMVEEKFAKGQIFYAITFENDANQKKLEYFKHGNWSTYAKPISKKELAEKNKNCLAKIHLTLSPLGYKYYKRNTLTIPSEDVDKFTGEVSLFSAFRNMETLLQQKFEGQFYKATMYQNNQENAKLISVFPSGEKQFYEGQTHKLLAR